VLLIGANIAENHPILCWRLRANPDTTLIVVDPRVTKTAMLADLHLPLVPAPTSPSSTASFTSSSSTASSIATTSPRHTTGFDELRESVREYTPERVAALTGLTPELVCRTAWTYAKANAAFIGWTMGVNHSTKGTETVNAINNLALITGNIGRAGAAPFSITGQCNAMGTREAGLPPRSPAIASSSVPPIARSWRASGTWPSIAFRRSVASPIPTSSRRCSSVVSARCGIIATNPIVSFPNLHSLQQALESARLSRGAGRFTTRRRRQSTRTSCCQRPCGARRRARIRTLSVASAR
jgi:assimilatory nitrate reductase catalytic subunit